MRACWLRLPEGSPSSAPAASSVAGSSVFHGPDRVWWAPVRESMRSRSWNARREDRNRTGRRHAAAAPGSLWFRPSDRSRAFNPVRLSPQAFSSPSVCRGGGSGNAPHHGGRLRLHKGAGAGRRPGSRPGWAAADGVTPAAGSQQHQPPPLERLVFDLLRVGKDAVREPGNTPTSPGGRSIGLGESSAAPGFLFLRK